MRLFIRYRGVRVRTLCTKTYYCFQMSSKDDNILKGALSTATSSADQFEYLCWCTVTLCSEQGTQKDYFKERLT